MGGPQAEADGVVSFNPQYRGQPATLTLTYKNEAESLSPASPCLGAPNEPIAVKGNLCVYRGSSVAKEVADKEIIEPQNEVSPAGTFADPLGEFFENKSTCVNETPHCNSGVLVIFRTKGFVEEGGGTVAGPAYLQARGSWGLTAN
jgi:hypothetical protein